MRLRAKVLQRGANWHGLVLRSQRHFSSSPKHHSEVPSFRSMLSRIAQITDNGVPSEKVPAMAEIVKAISANWRELLAGPEGFLTRENRRGLSGRGVEWGEMDTMRVQGHVNNVVYNRYAESARLNWVHIMGSIDRHNKQKWVNLMTPGGSGLILRSIKTHYKFPLTYPDRITVLHKLRPPHSPKSDHFWLDVVILSEKSRRVAARCEEDIVVYDYDSARKQPMDQSMAATFGIILEEQEAAKKQAEQSVRALDGRLMALERELGYRKD